MTSSYRIRKNPYLLIPVNDPWTWFVSVNMFILLSRFFSERRDVQQLFKSEWFIHIWYVEYKCFLFVFLMSNISALCKMLPCTINYANGSKENVFLWDQLTLIDWLIVSLCCVSSIGHIQVILLHKGKSTQSICQ